MVVRTSGAVGEAKSLLMEPSDRGPRRFRELSHPFSLGPWRLFELRAGSATMAQVSYYNSSVDIHPSARRHGVADADIEHATANAMVIEHRDDDTRLYLGPARNAALVEVVTLIRDDGSELAIHAMAMRSKYQRLLPGG